MSNSCNTPHLTFRCFALGLCVVAAWTIASSWVVAAQVNDPRFPSMYEDSALVDRISTGIAWTFNDRYQEAESLFKALDTEYPDSPIGPLFQAAVIHAAMLDAEDPSRKDDLLTTLEICEKRAEKQKKARIHEAEAEFALGLVDAYEAIYEARWGGWFAGLKRGLAAKDHFHEALKLDSTLTDCYVGLGNYHYWKAAKTRILGVLPFYKIDTKPGLAELRQAAGNGKHARLAAHIGLMWALLNEDRSAEALDIAEELEAEHPHARGIWWAKGAAFMAMYRWKEAIAAFDTVESSLRATTGTGNFYNMIECAYNRAKGYLELGEYARAGEECRKAESYPLTREVRSRQKDKLKELSKLKREINDLMAGP